jgi:hypothetical protein
MSAVGASALAPEFGPTDRVLKVETPAYGAARVSMKPNSPKWTLINRPPMEPTMNPAAIATTSSRRQSNRSRARTMPTIPWRRNKGPIVGIVL